MSGPTKYAIELAKQIELMEEEIKLNKQALRAILPKLSSEETTAYQGTAL